MFCWWAWLEWPEQVRTSLELAIHHVISYVLAALMGKVRYCDDSQVESYCINLLELAYCDTLDPDKPLHD
jgi:hypothetical protein